MLLDIYIERKKRSLKRRLKLKNKNIEVFIGELGRKNKDKNQE